MASKVKTFLAGLTDAERAELVAEVAAMAKPEKIKKSAGAASASTSTPGARTGARGDGLAMLKSLRKS